jgi:hypothetical protein
MVLLLLLPVFGTIHATLIMTNNDLMAADQRHLVTCVKTVLQRHIPPERPLMICLPGSLGNTKDAPSGSIHTQTYDIMLQAINEESKWLLHTTKPEVDTLKTSMEAEVSSVVYTVLSSEHGARNTANKLAYQVEDLRRKKSFNNRGTFFVVVTHSFESPKQLAEKIFETLWREFNILDVLVLTPVTSNTLFETGNRINDGKSVFRFYTRFPFHSSGDEIMLIDEYFVDTKVKSVHNSNLFPNKVPIKFQNHNILSVLTAELLPVTMSVNKSADENNTQIEYKGAEIDLFKLSLENVNLSYVYKPHDKDVPPSYALLANLITGDFDMMFASTPLHEKILQYGEPSTTNYETGYKWYVPCPAPIPRLEKISGIFSPSVWVSLIISFGAVTTVMWLLAKRSSKTENKDYRTVSNCIYNAWATALGVSAFQPSTTAMRTIFFLWICYCCSISTLFQTFFTSFLVNPGFGKQIENFKELLSSGLEYGYDQQLYGQFFDNSTQDVELDRLFKPTDCADRELCLLRVVNDNDFATLQVEFMTMYFVTIYLQKQSLLCYLKDNFRVIDIVFYFPQGSHFRFPINRVVRRIIEAGLMKKFENNMKELWKIQKQSLAVRYFAVKDNSVEDFFVFSTSHLQIAFWSLALGVGLSSVCLLFEILCYRLGVVQ